MVDPSGISHVRTHTHTHTHTLTHSAAAVTGLFQGYWGCAIGKAKQAAKTEIEKLQVSDLIRSEVITDRWNRVLIVCLLSQMKDMSCRELVKEVAKM